MDHTNRAHAKLSASSSHRWLNCPPSVMLEANFENESSSYAQEGTYMHELCEYKLRKIYFHEKFAERPKSDKWDSIDAEQLTDVYVEFVIKAIEELKPQPLVFIEAKLDYSHIAPEGFGTGDTVIIGKDTIHIIDFKGGAGVFVKAYKNSQLMLYALGALNAYGFIYDIKKIKMSIVQPRLDNINTYECTREELESWGESIKPVAKLAYEGKGEQKIGEWCKFCRARAVCQAHKNEALELAKSEFTDADSHEFKKAEAVPITELAEILPTLGRIKAWIDAVTEYVNDQAINHGVDIPGYKVVEGKSKRVFTDIDAVIKTAVENGYKDVYKQEVLTLTEFEKMMGKKKFAELLGNYVTKAKGKPTLVKE